MINHRGFSFTALLGHELHAVALFRYITRGIQQQLEVHGAGSNTVQMPSVVENERQHDHVKAHKYCGAASIQAHAPRGVAVAGSVEIDSLARSSPKHIF
jgi:hypothetical protein